MQQNANNPIKQRQLNIELLRIISMLMIVMLHFLGHGGILSSVKMLSLQYFLVWFLEGISYVAINCYVLISGYFLIKSNFKFKKLIDILLQVLFYSVFIYTILVITNQISFSIKGAIFSFMPVLTKQYWFVTIYLGMYILSPYINIFINAMSQKQHLLCIMIMTLLFSIWPNIFFFTDTLSFGGGRGVVWFITLYIVAAYIRLYYTPSYNVKKHSLIYFCISVTVPLSNYILSLIYQFTEQEFLLKGSDVFYQYNSILVYLSSISLFLLFINIRIKGNNLKKIISYFSPLTFGVYLIHDNNYLRTILWSGINAPQQLSHWYFGGYAFITVVIIYLVCSIIEKVRITLFNKVYKMNH